MKANSFCPIQNQCQRMTTSDQGDFAEECLKAHNEFREKHGVPPLTLNQGVRITFILRCLYICC